MAESTAIAAPAAPAPGFALFSSQAVLGASILGSPLAGCVLLAINDRRLGRRRQAVTVLVAGVIGTGALVGLVSLIPENLHLNFLGVVFAMAMKPLAEKYQGPLYAAHLAAGGAKGSRWAAAGVGVASLVAILAVIFGVALAAPGSLGEKVEFGQSEIYCGEGVTQAQAKAMAAALTAEKLGDESAISFRLSKHGAGYALGMVLQEGAWAKPEIRESMRIIGEQLHQRFEPSSPLTMELCDDQFEVKYAVPPEITLPATP